MAGTIPAVTPQSPVTVLPGIREARAALLGKLGIETVDDLVRHYPRGYEDRGDLKSACELCPGSTQAVILTISSPLKSTRVSSKAGRAMSVQKVTAHDDTGSVALTFFNRDFLKNTLVTGRRFRFYGPVSGTLLRPQMLSPAFEPLYEGKTLDTLVPLYPLTAGITAPMLSKFVKDALPAYRDYESLPDEILSRYQLCGLYDALTHIHFPTDAESLAASRHRLAFEELLEFQLRLRALKRHENVGEAERLPTPDMAPFYASLAYTLTGAQQRSLDAILCDMAGSTEGTGHIPPMRRLVQGDVGSGKTIVAAGAVYACVKNGAQAALMVPTELLASQHYETLLPLMEEHHIVTALLTGSTKPSEKKRITEALADGRIDFVIGTHALIEDGVVFSRPGLMITDEQHRFGVRQREKLSGKSAGSLRPHMLVMSATPIPRTLAMILYGDLDISVIDELPPGRQKVDTFAVGESMRERVYAFIRKQVEEGRQVYIVCPLAEESESEFSTEEAYEEDLKSAEAYCRTLSTDVFPDLSVAFIHGKMKPKDKDAIMRDFAEGKTSILVSTTVIEVGVNVPNATLMIVENAERFGLSQLHQLRGRVGRGSYKSYCILLSGVIKGQTASASSDSVAEKRFRILCDNASGFKIAEYDLELRGPGDFFGRRQHGDLHFRIADIAADMLLVEETKALADELCRNEN